MESTSQNSTTAVPINNQGTSTAPSTDAADPSTHVKKQTRPPRHFNNNKKNQDDKKPHEKKTNGDAAPRRPRKKKETPKTDTPANGSTNIGAMKKDASDPIDEDNNDDDEDDDEDDACFICTEPIVTYAVSACNHRTCHLCALRLRALYHTKNCVYCNTEQKTMIFTKDPTKPFEAFTKKDIFYVDRKLDIRFEDKLTHQDTVLLLQYNCPEPNCDVACSGWGELKKHTNKEHHLVLCDLCTKNKKIFAHEHTLYTPAQLNKHYKAGDKEALNKEDDDSGFKGHPECHFCRQSFYGDDELFVHCRDKHEQCHICVRNGVRHEYYADYNGLEKHFKKEHYLCMYRECLDKKFIVFDTDLDLKAHEVETHGASGRVDLHFEYGSRPGETGRGKGKPKIQQQQQQQQRHQESSASASASSTPALTSTDFPSINGSPSSSERTVPGQPKKSRQNDKQGPNARLQKPKGFGSLSTNNEEQWPGLGQAPSSGPGSATASPSSSSKTTATSKEPDTKQRHAEVLQKLGRLLNGPQAVERFRALTTAYRNNSLDGAGYVGEIINLCNNDPTKAGTILKDVEDLMDSQEKKRDVMRAWRNAQANMQNFPALAPLDNRTGTQGTSQRVLVIKGGSTRVGGTRTTSKSKAGVWDRVANAAAHGAPSSSQGSSPRGSPVSSRPSSPMSFPTPQLNRTKTAWAGTGASSPSSQSSQSSSPAVKDDFPAMATQQFPSLPSSGSSRRTHPTVLNMRRNNNSGSAWSPSSDRYSDYDFESTDDNTEVVSVDKKKKGKKGKQVLFRVGL